MQTRPPSQLDLVGFEYFRDQLSDDIDEKKVIRWSYAHRFPPFVRFGRNRPRWDKQAVDYWFANRLQKAFYPAKAVTDAAL